MSIAENTSAVVCLEWSLNESGRLLITPRDNDRFMLKVNRAIEILQQGHAVEKFTQQFNVLLRVLAEWIRDKEGIAKAYLTERDGVLAFVVVRDSCRYDDDFEDEISGLDFRLARDPDLNLITLNVIALPAVGDGAISSFVDPSFALEYVGHGNRSGSYSAGQ